MTTVPSPPGPLPRREASGTAGSGHAHSTRQPLRRSSDFLIAFLARHSIPISPEQLAPAEGVRAAFATVVALLPALYEHEPVLAWAAFATFWSCLIEPGGTAREQFRILGWFTVGGTLLGGITAFVANDPLFGVVPWIALAALATGLARAFTPSTALLWTLLAAVMLAGTGFPAREPRDALVLAGSFGAGGLWAMFLCLVLWRLHPYASARRGVAACYSLLSDMAGELAAGHLRETVHRQNIRTAIERARGMALQIDAGHPSYWMRGRLVASLAAAERLFTAMLAVEHLVETRGLDFEARGTLAALSALYRRTSDAVLVPTPELDHLSSEAFGLADAIPRSAGAIGELVATSARTLGTLSAGLAAKEKLPFDAEAPRHVARLTPAIWQHVLRLEAGTLATYAACWGLGLSYGFWALVAVILVIQPSGQTTLVRALERTLGSVGGGLMALVLTPFLPGTVQMLAGVALFVIGAIAMRAVNYTMLVVFLSALFIIVTEMIMPSHSVAWMRVLDNAIGSLIGLVCAYIVCPQGRGTDLDRLLRTAIAGNLRYLAAVLRQDDPTTTDRIQRQAGIDTTRAEFARGSLPILGGISAIGERSEQAHTILRALRRLSGEATILRFDIAAGLCLADAEQGKAWDETASALDAGSAETDVIREIEDDTIRGRIAALERSSRRSGPSI